MEADKGKEGTLCCELNHRVVGDREETGNMSVKGRS